MQLDHETCYRALATRDARFDGLFFTGVTTTRIYCRPVCTARLPRADRCRFFLLAAEAEQAGFRPCLRCRPELAPGNSSVDAVSRVARAAAALIERGALNGGGTEALAAELGISSRQLRRCVGRELGVSPVQLAQTHRLLLAKQLLTETRLPITEVALASGFESLRRFNALFRTHYRLAPRDLRRAGGSKLHADSLNLHLGYRPPLAWPEMLRFLAARAIAGCERADGAEYVRTVAIGRHTGWLRATLGKRPNTLVVEFSTSLTPALAPLLARLRGLFDLGARPDVIRAHLAGDAHLGPLVRRLPGLRVPGSFDGFELAWRAILGQQVTVRGASTLAARVAREFGRPIATPDPMLDRLTPEPATLAAARIERFRKLGITRDRAEAIRAIAAAVVDGSLRLEPGADPQQSIELLTRLPGIGAWTAQYIAMRALSWPDALPEGDIALRRGLGEPSPVGLRAMAEAWRPWRSYAAMHVWNNLSPQAGRRKKPCAVTN
jgi:AraC family transcriptional regulator of adaptative response / DNA-3-methyladenine glycosylase II